MSVKSGIQISTELEGTEMIAMSKAWSIDKADFFCIKVDNLPLTFQSLAQM